MNTCEIVIYKPGYEGTIFNQHHSSVHRAILTLCCTGELVELSDEQNEDASQKGN